MVSVSLAMGARKQSLPFKEGPRHNYAFNRRCARVGVAAGAVFLEALLYEIELRHALKPYVLLLEKILAAAIRFSLPTEDVGISIKDGLVSSFIRADASER